MCSSNGHASTLSVMCRSLWSTWPDWCRSLRKDAEGNAFLADLAGCDALIQVVDGSGRHGRRGHDFTGHGPRTAAASIAHEVTFLTTELEQWIASVLAMAGPAVFAVSKRKVSEACWASSLSA